MTERKNFVVRDSWNGDIISKRMNEVNATKLKDALNEKSRKAKPPKYMGITPYLQSYYVYEYVYELDKMIKEKVQFT